MIRNFILLFQKIFLSILITPLLFIQACASSCDSECHVKQGIEAYKANKNIVAQAAFLSAIKKGSNLPEAYNNLGVTLVEQNKFEEAIIAFRKSLSLAPNYGEAQANLGFALEKKGDLKAATIEFTKKLSITPNMERSALSLELGLPEGRGVLTEKIANYQKEIANKPSSWVAHYNLGVALDEQGDLQGAITAYKRTIQLNPTFADAHGNLGNALVLSGKKEEGLSYMRRCRDLFKQQGREYDVRKAEQLLEQLKRK